MTAQSVISKTGSGYVFEVHEDNAVSFRRADMEDRHARKRYVRLAQLPDGKTVMKIFQAEREPGKNSGRNALITNVDRRWKH